MRSRSAGRAPALTVFLVLLLASLSGCGVPAAVVNDAGRGDLIPDDAASAPTTEVTTVRDPVENAFTVAVPVGWDSVAYSAGKFDVHREVVSSVSPDGKTVLFMGDPKLPTFIDPGSAHSVIVEFDKLLEYYEIRAYQPAESYFPDYVTRKFGELPGFGITSVESQPGTVSSLQKSFVDAGLPAPEAHAVEVRFEYTASGELIHGLVVGLTLNSGSFWQVDVLGLATNRDVEEYRPMLVAMSKSKQSNPEFTARFQADTQNNLAQIKAFGDQFTAQHNANMAWIQQSAAAHQSRMEAIWAQGDASMQSFYDRMDSMDHTQRDFLNSITEEETVSGGSTGTRQVATGATNYWVNKYDGTYVGGDINFGDTQLRQMGLNPDDYEQVTVIK
ncbi:MAG: hypothetical protein IT190_06965 [Microbacteriaceae bacterium]|nr:hypothetical protein [Microbacteriaceae bacterium]